MWLSRAFAVFGNFLGPSLEKIVIFHANLKILVSDYKNLKISISEGLSIFLSPFTTYNVTIAAILYPLLNF